MRPTTAILLISAVFIAFVFSGCGKDSSNGGAKPARANSESIRKEHGHGKQGGWMSHVGTGHKILAEIVLSKDLKSITIYLVDHDKPEIRILSSDREFTITGLKDQDKKDIPPIKLEAKPDTERGEKPETGSSRFVSTGGSLPAGITSRHSLVGGKFTVTIADKKHLTKIEKVPADKKK